MPSVKRVEANGLIQELKSFAFERYPSFRYDHVDAVETTQRFFLEDEDVEYDQPSTVVLNLGFTAARIYSSELQRPEYSFKVTSELTNNLTELEDRHLVQLSKKARKHLRKHPSYDIVEQQSLEYMVESHNPYDLDKMYHYRVHADEKMILNSSSDDMLFDNTGTFADIPVEESFDNSGQLFIPDTISYDSIQDESDRFLVHQEFFDIVDPYVSRDTYDHENWRVNARTIRHILRQMKTGQVALRRFETHQPKD